jgi:hypothetical protein
MAELRQLHQVVTTIGPRNEVGQGRKKLCRCWSGRDTPLPQHAYYCTVHMFGGSMLNAVSKENQCAGPARAL